MADERATEVKWPGDENPEGPWGAEAVMCHLAYLGLTCAARSVDMLPKDWKDEVVVGRYAENLAVMQGCHDLYLALDALRELNPAKADETADRVILAAVAGDSYGEWLWQWADEHGLDADAISDASRAAITRQEQER